MRPSEYHKGRGGGKRDKTKGNLSTLVSEAEKKKSARVLQSALRGPGKTPDTVSVLCVTKTGGSR